jgi:N-acetylglucosamine-6-phosphate deacetylase
VSIGLSLADASNRLSLFPANYLNEPQRGRLQIGAFSDIVTVNKKLKLTQVYIEGEKVELK